MGIRIIAAEGRARLPAKPSAVIARLQSSRGDPEKRRFHGDLG
jgi:hypothetical protein